MSKKQLVNSAAIVAVLILAGCGSNDAPTNTSMLNPNAPSVENTGEPGGDITPIAGLWDGSIAVGDANDIVYWNLAADGVITRYDYQQDGVPTASGENCYSIDQPITVTPEGGEDYSIFDVAVTAVRSADTLSVTFNEADKNDLNQNDDVLEIPVLSWALLTTPSLADLNACTTAVESSDASFSNDALFINSTSDGELHSTPNSFVELGSDSSDLPLTVLLGSSGNASNPPPMTRAQCALNSGIAIGDIGNGAIHSADYRCESGQPPIARIAYLEGELIASEGEVCCV